MKCLIFSILTLVAGFFCANCYAEIAPDIQKIITSGKLIIALPNRDFPPFFYHNIQQRLPLMRSLAKLKTIKQISAWVR